MKTNISIRALLGVTLLGALFLTGDSLARDRGDGPGAGATGGSSRWSGPSGATSGSSGRSYYSDRGGSGSASGLAGRSWVAPSTTGTGNASAVRSWGGERSAVSGAADKAPVARSWGTQKSVVSSGSVSGGGDKALVTKAWTAQKSGDSPGWVSSGKSTRSGSDSSWRVMGNAGKTAGADVSTKSFTGSTWRTMGTGRGSGATGNVQRGTASTSSRLAAGGFFRDRRPIDRLPEHARSYDWHGRRYHHEGHHWWRPWWYGGEVYYYWVYPPIGYYYTDLPEGCSTVLLGGTTYWVGEGVYYGTATDRPGYVVAEPPGGIPAPEASGEAAPPELVPPEGAEEPASIPLGQLSPPEPPRAADPYALLKQMADSLAGLPRLTLVVGDSFEEVAGDQRKELQGQFTLFLRRPDKLAVQYRGDMYDRNVIYDGTGVTLLNLRKNFYWRAAAPATIPAALEALARDYRVSMPLAELVTSDFGALTAALREGRYLGTDAVGDRTYHHLGFREDAVDWEVWLEADGPALPRRYAVTYKQLPGAPRYVATVVSWDTGPVPDSCFQLPTAPDRVPPR
ncbi:MAG: DUF2092 domain-containing protein [Planctomycetota bacterium]|nr:DUF2092 domain-containing protein [Planctomycetota bacterium]